MKGARRTVLVVVIVAAAASALADQESPVQAAAEPLARTSASGPAQKPRLDAYPWGRRVRTAARFARRRRGTVSFAVVDERGRIHGWHRGRRRHSASVVKVMLMTAYLNRRSVRHRRLRAHDKRLLKPMIRRSDNAAASAIYGLVGNAGLNRVAHRAGMRRFRPYPVWGLSWITARDQSRFMYRLRRYIPRRHRKFALSLLTQIVHSQRWGMPHVRPRHWRIHFKGGWVPSSSWRVNQVALLTRGKRRISLGVLTRNDGTLHYGAGTIAGVARRLLYRYNPITAPG